MAEGWVRKANGDGKLHFIKEWSSGKPYAICGLNKINEETMRNKVYTFIPLNTERMCQKCGESRLKDLLHEYSQIAAEFGKLVLALKADDRWFNSWHRAVD